MNENSRLDEMYNDLFKEFNTSSKELQNIFDVINKKKEILLNKIKENPKKNNRIFINLIDNLSIIKNDLDLIVERMDKITVNFSENMITDCKDMLEKKIEDEKRIKEVMKPFLPYMLIYNLLL